MEDQLRFNDYYQDLHIADEVFEDHVEVAHHSVVGGSISSAGKKTREIK